MDLYRASSAEGSEEFFTDAPGDGCIGKTTEGKTMNAFKGTPGPWTYTGSDSVVPLLRVICSDDKHPAHESRSYDEKQANARLMAAAPDLLESLTNLVGLAELGAARLDKYKHALEVAKTAISKATSV